MSIINRIKRKMLDFVLEYKQVTHVAKITKLEKLPNGKFVEVEIGANQVLIGGLNELMFLLYNKRAPFTSPTFEDELYSTANVDLRPNITINNSERNTPFIQGFNVSFDGSAGNGIVDYPKHGNGFNFDSLIPFRVIPVEKNDFAVFKKLYLHHREVVIGGKHFIEYYTKKPLFTVKAVLKNGEAIPNNPEINVKTDLPSRTISEFPVNITEEELVEHFRLRHEGSEGAFYNSTMLMIGNMAKININGTEYDTMLNTKAYSKANHLSISHGSDAFLNVKYQMMHV